MKKSRKYKGKRKKARLNNVPFEGGRADVPPKQTRRENTPAPVSADANAEGNRFCPRVEQKRMQNEAQGRADVPPKRNAEIKLRQTRRKVAPAPMAYLGVR